MINKKIWIVTELFYPEETAVAYIFSRIANFLSFNYDISVICGPELFDKNKIDFKDDYQISRKIIIYRTSTFFDYNKNSLIQRTLRIISLSIRMSILVLTKIKRGEIVLLSTHPVLLMLIICFFKKFNKIQLHILVHDVFPENTIPARIFKNNKSIVYKLLKYIFDKAYSKADHLIAIGRDMGDILIKKTERFKSLNSVSVVPNWAFSEKQSVNSKNLKFKSNKQNKIVLQYSGNIGRVQGVKEIIDAFIKSDNPDIYLIIRGTGAQYEEIKQFIDKMKPQNIKLYGAYSRSDEMKFLSESDISIVSLKKGMYGLGVPSKTYNILSAGKPILFVGDPDSEVSLMVREHNNGWVIDIEKERELIDFLDNLKFKNRKEIQKKGLISRSLAETYYEENNILTLFQKKMEKHFKD